MTPSAADIKSRAARRNEELERVRRDPRFARVVGRLVAEGLLHVNYAVKSHRDPIRVKDALFAGNAEPRVFELLPALLVELPSMFSDPARVPDDLAASVRALRRGEPPPEFRGIPGEDQARWPSRLNRDGRPVTRLKSFRLTSEDQRLLSRLARTMDTTETDVLRRALRVLAGEQLQGSTVTEP